MLDSLFTLANSLALLAWVLLILLPTWNGIAQACASYIIPSLIASAYLALLGIWGSRSDGGFGSLDEVHKLFQVRGALLAGWLHYLAFDLFIGAWIARECRREGLPHVLVVPLLMLTFLFGPIGYVGSLATRAAWRIRNETRSTPRKPGRFGIARPDPILLAASFLCIVVAVPAFMASILDDRLLDGFNLWHKPIKFDVSVGIYLATLALFLPLAGSSFRSSLAGRYVVWVSIATGFLELIYINLQAARGEASHFNDSSAAAQVLYALMGVGALLLSTSGGLTAWGVSKADSEGVDPAFRLAVVIGLALSFVLGTLGGIAISVHGAHSVGRVIEGDPSLPFAGWSRTIGDLRVAHFFGLHAQQLIPLFAMAASLLGGRFSKPAIKAFALIYALVVILLFVQALRGVPFSS